MYNIYNFVYLYIYILMWKIFYRFDKNRHYRRLFICSFLFSKNFSKKLITISHQDNLAFFWYNLIPCNKKTFIKLYDHIA